MAQSLKTKRSYTIGLIVENITNPYFPEIIKGVQEVAEDYGYNVFLCDNRRDPLKGIQHLESLQSRGVDGIIFTSGRNLGAKTSEKIQSISKEGTPFVFLWRDKQLVNIPSIHNNEVDASYLAVKHLIKLGHTSIGFIGGFPEFWVTKERFKGYEKALKESNLFKPNLVFYSDFEVSGGKERALEMLNMSPPPTAIFAIDDLMALGVLEAAKDMKIRVPEQLSVIGFNDIDYAKFMNPPLTTIGFPRYEMGKLAAEMIFQQLNDNETLEENQITLEGSLIVRGTCGAVRTKKLNITNSVEARGVNDESRYIY